MIHLIVSHRSRALTEIPLEDRRAAPESQRVGTLISQDQEGGPEQHIDLIQCCHCQRTWPWVKDSGRLRGWCNRCAAFFCGPRCEVCVHWRQMLANMGAGLPFEEARRQQPIQVSVPCAVPQSTGGVLLGKG